MQFIIMHPDHAWGSGPHSMHKWGKPNWPGSVNCMDLQTIAMRTAYTILWESVLYNTGWLPVKKRVRSFILAICLRVAVTINCAIKVCSPKLTSTDKRTYIAMYTCMYGYIILLLLMISPTCTPDVLALETVRIPDFPLAQPACSSSLVIASIHLLTSRENTPPG